MKVSREDSLTQPFVLEDSDLENLCSRLQKWVTNFNFEITNKDSLKREFSNLADLLLFENPPNKDIETLRLRGSSSNLETRIWIRFDKNSLRNVFISIEGDEAAAMAINDCLEESLAAIKPWYALLARINFYLILLAIYLLPAALFLIAVGLGIIKIQSAPSSNLESRIQSFVIGVLSGFIPIIFGTFLNNVKRSMFPMGVFALGQGAKRHKDKEIVRTVVVVAFFVSLASSILGTLIFALWR